MPYSTYLTERMGSARMAGATRFRAAEIGTIAVEYTAGDFGIDDGGAIKLAWRHCCDMAAPQTDDPRAPAYASAEASNDAVLACSYSPKGSFRPFSKTLMVTVAKGYLAPGDTITVRIGDTRGGSPGIRMQSVVESGHQIRMLADPINTRDFAMLPEVLTFDIHAAPRRDWVAVLPTLRRTGEAFRLCVRQDDAYGNPSDQGEAHARLQANLAVDGLPDAVHLAPGDFAAVVDGLVVREPGDLVIALRSADGALLAESNPMRVVAGAGLLPYWADFHHQTRETVGMSTAAESFAYARDRAFIDVTSHAGNDLQIAEIWAGLERAFEAYDEPGRFVVLPGYEWSGNTALGGDRNVLFRDAGGEIRRSSHALVPDLADADRDCHTIEALFAALRESPVPALTLAHVGRRHCDIRIAHDPLVDRSVEIQSATWGTFEWVLRDAFERGYRMGVVGNSDDHKGRPGSSPPGFAGFGTIGGLTCLLLDELSRAGVWTCLERRRHYATTGARIHLDVRARPGETAERFEENPQAGPTRSEPADELTMGDIARVRGEHVELAVEVLAPAPVHRIEIRNGLETVETFHPHAGDPRGNRVHVTFEGAERRGRDPKTTWDGEARVEGTRIGSARPIRFDLLSKRLTVEDETRVTWTAQTTGNVVGVALALAGAGNAVLSVRTPQGEETIAVAELGAGERVFEYGGIDRRMRVFCLPEENPHRAVSLIRRVALRSRGDNPLYVCVTLEDGHRAWSSPIYLFR